jgi:predicted HicB family RNase H-like nuclease
MKKRTGRPPKPPTTRNTTLTLRITSTVKTQLIEQAEAYDMSITEYLTTLIERDATQT